MLGGVLNQFLFDVDWGELDYLIIDLPPGTGDMQLSLVQATEVTGAVIISTPQDLALLDAKKGLEMFRKVKVPILGMVENMSYFICDGCGKEHHPFGEGGVEKAADGIGVKLLGKVPLEMEVRMGSDKGTPFMSDFKFEDTKTWEAYLEIAKKFSQSENGEKKTGVFKRFLNKVTGKD